MVYPFKQGEKGERLLKAVSPYIIGVCKMFRVAWMCIVIGNCQEIRSLRNAEWKLLAVLVLNYGMRSESFIDGGE